MNWTLSKSQAFVHINHKDAAGRYRFRAHEIARRLGCTTYAVQGMRRKAVRLADLGVTNADELAFLLLISEPIMMRLGLAALRLRAGKAARGTIEVGHFLRRGRVSGRVHLVAGHDRAPMAEE